MLLGLVKNDLGGDELQGLGIERVHGHSGSGWREASGQPLGGRLALEGEREALVVVRHLPGLERAGRRVEVGEALAAPELLVVDAMTALHLAVLLRPARADVAMFNPSRLHG